MEMQQNNKRIISTVYLWQNGMVMVFDQFGEQMPEYQGKFADVRASIVRDAPAAAEFFRGEWRIFGSAVSTDDFDS